MKKLIVLLLALLILITQFTTAFSESQYTVGNPDVSNWFAWEWPDDKKAMGTAIDASFLLDAPSGKHGFVSANDDHMFFDDGTQAKFWGTAIVMQANFMDKEDAEKMADRIARCGFNLVRFHHLDIGTSKNIFSAGNVTTTKKLDPGQLDKLFYFMSLLKERGIYFYVDMLVMRPAIEGEAFATEDLDQGLKPMAIFDPTLLSMQKEYAKQLLTTVNPYTGMSLAEDPSMVFIDIHNEHSLFEIEANKITSSFYRAELQSQFNRWLAKKYPSRSELEQAWKEQGKTGLEPKENFAAGTVNIIGDGTVKIPDLYDKLNYSQSRKNDYYEFYYDKVASCYVELRDYLHEIGVKCLITGTSMGGSTNKRAATVHINESVMDYTDNHTYKSHPSGYGYGKGTKLTSWTSSTIAGGGELYRSSPWLRAYDQPFVIGEWQVCSPGPYAAEGTLVQAALSSYQNWTPVQFDMSSDGEIPDEGSRTTTFFATYVSPDITSIQPAAAMIYLRGDVKEPDGAYYVTYDKDDVLNNKIYKSAYLLGFENAWLYIKTGMASEENLKDGEQFTPEALEKAIDKYNRNDSSGDIDWNKRSGLFRVDTAYTNAATGYIGGKKISLSFSDIEVKNPSATVSINSVSRDTLEDTNRILLTILSKGRPTNLEMDDANITIVSPGTGPMILEPIEAKITIKTQKDITVYALDSSGQRKQTLEVTKTSDGYSCFNVGKEFKTVHYEIVK